jgi:hypothetical protein
MGAWRLFVGLVGTLAVIAAALAAYYALSYFVLYVVGRLLPLAGRRRRD